MSSPWLMSGTTSFTPAPRSARTAGESSSRSSIATAPDPAWKYARIGSFGAMSIGGVSSTRARFGARVSAVGATLRPPKARRKVLVREIISAPFYAAGVRESLRLGRRSQTLAWVGCIVWATVARRSPRTASRSTWSRSRTVNSSTVRAESKRAR